MPEIHMTDCACDRCTRQRAQEAHDRRRNHIAAARDAAVKRARAMTGAHDTIIRHMARCTASCRKGQCMDRDRLEDLYQAEKAGTFDAVRALEEAEKDG